MAISVLPLEASNTRRRDAEGNIVVGIPQVPDIIGEVEPLQVAGREIAAPDASVLIEVSGDLSQLHLGWDAERGQLILQDSMRSDILQAHIDFNFELRNALLSIKPDWYSSIGSAGLHPESVLRYLKLFIDDWASHNAWAVMCAIASGRWQTKLSRVGGVGPEYVKYVVSNFSETDFATALNAMEAGVGSHFRHVNEFDPTLEGHVEYHFSPTETDDNQWAVRADGVVSYRYKTGIAPVPIWGINDEPVGFASPFTPTELPEPLLPNVPLPTFGGGRGTCSCRSDHRWSRWRTSALLSAR